MNKDEFCLNVWPETSNRFRKYGFHALTEGEKASICITYIMVEVQNGGFDTYYYNSSGNYAIYAPDLLELVGASKHAALFRRANAVFGPDGPPEDREKRQAMLYNLSEADVQALESLTSDFFDMDDPQDYFEDYAWDHRNEFLGLSSG